MASKRQRTTDFFTPATNKEVKSLPDKLNALLYVCFNVGPPLMKAVVALAAAVGFFLIGLTVRRFGKSQNKQQHNESSEDFNKFDGGDDADAESGELIVKRGGPASQLLAAKHLHGSYLPLQHIVPTSSVVVDYDDYSPDSARGR